MESQEKVREEIRRQLDSKRVIAIEICGRLGGGKTTVVEHLSVALGRMRRVGVVTPGLPAAVVPSATSDEVGVWSVEEVSRLTPALLLDTLAKLPLDALDYLFVEQNRDPTCGEPVLLGCHARGVVLPISEGLEQIDEARLAIQLADFVLFTQGDVQQEVDFDRDAARERVWQIEAEIPIFLLSYAGHSDWLEWLGYLDLLREEHLRPSSAEGPSSDHYLG